MHLHCPPRLPLAEGTFVDHFNALLSGDAADISGWLLAVLPGLRVDVVDMCQALPPVAEPLPATTINEAECALHVVQALQNLAVFTDAQAHLQSLDIFDGIQCAPNILGCVRLTCERCAYTSMCRVLRLLAFMRTISAPGLVMHVLVPPEHQRAWVGAKTRAEFDAAIDAAGLHPHDAAFYRRYLPRAHARVSVRVKVYVQDTGIHTAVQLLDDEIVNAVPNSPVALLCDFESDDIISGHVFHRIANAYTALATGTRVDTVFRNTDMIAPRELLRAVSIAGDGRMIPEMITATTTTPEPPRVPAAVQRRVPRISISRAMPQSSPKGSVDLGLEHEPGKPLHARRARRGPNHDVGTGG